MKISIVESEPTLVVAAADRKHKTAYQSFHILSDGGGREKFKDSQCILGFQSGRGGILRNHQVHSCKAVFLLDRNETVVIIKISVLAYFDVDGIT